MKVRDLMRREYFMVATWNCFIEGEEKEKEKEEEDVVNGKKTTT